jgi:hypothetical protein
VNVVGRGRTVLVAAIVAVLAIGSCSSDSPEDSHVRAEAVYDSVVRWFAQRESGDPDPLPVFIEPRGEGASIQLDVQAKVVDSTKDVATVRFIDTRDEALVTNDDGVVVVADDGVLLRLDPVVEKGNSVKLDVDVHDRDDHFVTYEFDLDRSGETWRIDRPPVEVPGA